MRVFFALPIAPQSSLDILHWREKVFPRDRQGIAAENFHITLSFVGDVTSTQCDSLVQATNELWQHSPAEEISLSVNQYSYWLNPGIFWIGPTHWSNALSRLRSKLNGLSQACTGRATKHAFQPHISLYRTKEAIPKPLIQPHFELNFDEVILFESISKKQSVYYQELAVWPLEKPHTKANADVKSRPLPNKQRQ